MILLFIIFIAAASTIFAFRHSRFFSIIILYRWRWFSAFSHEKLFIFFSYDDTDDDVADDGWRRSMIMIFIDFCIMSHSSSFFFTTFSDDFCRLHLPFAPAWLMPLFRRHFRHSSGIMMILLQHFESFTFIARGRQAFFSLMIMGEGLDGPPFPFPSFRHLPFRFIFRGIIFIDTDSFLFSSFLPSILLLFLLSEFSGRCFPLPTTIQNVFFHQYYLVRRGREEECVNHFPSFFSHYLQRFHFHCRPFFASPSLFFFPRDAIICPFPPPSPPPSFFLPSSFSFFLLPMISFPCLYLSAFFPLFIIIGFLLSFSFLPTAWLKVVGGKGVGETHACLSHAKNVMPVKWIILNVILPNLTVLQESNSKHWWNERTNW